MDVRLYYFASDGVKPRAGSLAYRIWVASTADDEALWESLFGTDEISEEELMDAVDQLRSLGWDFYYGALQ